MELEGLTQQTAAKRMGLSLSGMKSRVQRGRARLKQMLDDCCLIELDRRGGSRRLSLCAATECDWLVPRAIPEQWTSHESGVADEWVPSGNEGTHRDMPGEVYWSG